MKQLLASHGAWSRLPSSLTLKPLQSIRQEPLTDEMKKRWEGKHRKTSWFHVVSGWFSMAFLAIRVGSRCRTGTHTATRHR